MIMEDTAAPSNWQGSLSQEGLPTSVMVVGACPQSLGMTWQLAEHSARASSTLIFPRCHHQSSSRCVYRYVFSSRPRLLKAAGWPGLGAPTAHFSNRLQLGSLAKHPPGESGSFQEEHPFCGIHSRRFAAENVLEHGLLKKAGRSTPA